MTSFSPGLILILGALPVPFLRGAWRGAYMLALPLVGLVYVLLLEPGQYGPTPVRVIDFSSMSGMYQFEYTRSPAIQEYEPYALHILVCPDLEGFTAGRSHVVLDICWLAELHVDPAAAPSSAAGDGRRASSTAGG